MRESKSVRLAAGFLAATLVLAAGCLTADGTVGPDGAATLTISYPTRATPDKDFLARMMVTSPGVTIESLEIADAAPVLGRPRRATAKLSTKNATTLAKTPLLRTWQTEIVHETRAHGGGTFIVRFTNPKPEGPDDPGVAELMKHQFRLTLTLPGPVVETSATKLDGGVEWTFPIGDFRLGRKLELTATYGASSSEKSHDRGAPGEEPRRGGS